LRNQPTVAHGIACILAVLSAVSFDDQSSGWAGEVDDVASNWELTAEFPAFETLGAEQLPQPMFGVGLIATKLSRPVSEAPSPQPLPHKGGGAFVQAA